MPTSKRTLLFGFIFLTFALGVPLAPGATLNPVADAFVTTGSDGSLSGNNYGGTGALAVSAPSPAKPQGEFQSVLRFDLSATKAAFDAQFGPGQWSVQSLTLQLTATPKNNTIFNDPTVGQFGISWMQNDSWAEGTGSPSIPTMDGITYNTLQSTFINSLVDENLGTFTSATSGVSTFTLSLTSGLTADILNGGLLSLRLFSADSNVSYLFNSRSVTTAANRPLLTIIAVPEPGSFALGLAGLSLLVGWKRRRGSI